MFCANCGSKIEQDACVCLNCGVLVKARSQVKVIKRKKNSNSVGFISCLFGVLAFCSSIMLFFYDISPVGMYTEVYERIYYVIDYSIFAILLSAVSLVLSLSSKKNIYSKIGTILSFLSFFFIITEFIVVIIY